MRLYAGGRKCMMGLGYLEAWDLLNVLAGEADI